MLLYFSKVKLTQNSTSVLVPFHLATHVPRHALPCQLPCKPQSRTPHACTALRHISPECACPCLFACIGLASTRFARSLFSFHPPPPHLPHIHISFPSCCYKFLLTSLLALSVSPSECITLSNSINKEGGWQGRHCYCMSMLHMDLACYCVPMLHMGLCYCVPVLHTGFALLLLTLVA